MSKFKDKQGRWRTQSLFIEYNKDDPLFTLKDRDVSPDVRSFARLYLELADPTEYTQAKTLVGGWEHWQALCGSQWFSNFIAPLREELEVKLRSEAIVATYEIMQRRDKSALPAAKFFTDTMYNQRKQGRPSKAEVQAEARKRAMIKERLEKDAERLNLH